MNRTHKQYVGRLLAIAAVLSGLAGWPASASRAAELIMFEQAGCYWCAVWNEQVGIAYPKTWEGKMAPLRRLNIHERLPQDLAGLSKGRFTPTFVVWHDGREIGRIQGYNPDFFWPMLDEILHKVDPGAGAAQSGPGTVSKTPKG